MYVKERALTCAGLVDLPDFTDNVANAQWCIHLPAYSAYVTNKTKK